MIENYGRVGSQDFMIKVLGPFGQIDVSKLELFVVYGLQKEV